MKGKTGISESSCDVSIFFPFCPLVAMSCGYQLSRCRTNHNLSMHGHMHWLCRLQWPLRIRGWHACSWVNLISYRHELLFNNHIHCWRAFHEPLNWSVLHLSDSAIPWPAEEMFENLHGCSTVHTDLLNGAESNPVAKTDLSRSSLNSDLSFCNMQKTCGTKYLKYTTRNYCYY